MALNKLKVLVVPTHVSTCCGPASHPFLSADAACRYDQRRETTVLISPQQDCGSPDDVHGWHPVMPLGRETPPSDSKGG